MFAQTYYARIFGAERHGGILSSWRLARHSTRPHLFAAYLHYYKHERLHLGIALKTLIQVVADVCQIKRWLTGESGRSSLKVDPVFGNSFHFTIGDSNEYPSPVFCAIFYGFRGWRC